MERQDVRVVTGLSDIINPDNIKPGINLKELEEQMISGGLISQPTREPEDKFTEEMKKVAGKLGISFDNISGSKQKNITIPSKNSGIYTNPTHNLSESSSSEESEGDEHGNNRNSNYNTNYSTNYNNKYSSPRLNSPKLTSPKLTSPKLTNSEHNDYWSNNKHSGYSSQSTKYDNRDNEYDDEDSRDDDNSTSTNRFNTHERPRYGSLEDKTAEQMRKSHIDTVLGTSKNTFSFDDEKKEDLKCTMISEIDSLITTLTDEDVDISRIPKVTRESSYAEVESVLKILRRKNDHTRYCSLADEFILFGAYALEELFNGKRTWFGQYTPDLTGWHTHVNVKLKRMRHDTGQIVSGVMQDYNIGSAARVVLELLPSMILYSKTRKQQHNMPGVFSDEEMTNHLQNIRTTTSST